MMLGITYQKVDSQGVHISNADGTSSVVKADTIVVCAGQQSRAELAAALNSAGKKVTIIGGAENSQGLDAARAIGQAVHLAFQV